MKFSEINKVFFLGIGGIGMSAIARFFLNSGKIVYGYDLTSSVLTKTLEDEGAIIHYQDDENNIPENLDLVIYTPAIPSTNKEYHYLNNSNIPMLKRSQALGIICEDFFTIAIAGTHGKTTTSSMVAHLLQNAGKNVTAFIGGIMSNYSTNFITAKNTEIIVVEADEFDRSFLALYPDCATITSVDSDHLDIYGNQNNLISTFRQFASQIKPNGRLFIKPDLSLTINNVKVDKYGLDSLMCPTNIQNIRVEQGHYIFDYFSEDRKIENIEMSIGGIHNIENACAAISICLHVGLSVSDIISGLKSFKGVKRRFERIIDGEFVFIDDYAHHPTEIMSVYNSLKNLFIEKKIVAVFQPHLFSRTKDFYKDFAKSLDGFDEVLLLPVYPARELPISGVSTKLILDEMENENARLVDKDELLNYIEEKNFDVLVTLGAGDIDKLVNPIKEILK